jgi:hypothetical protein
MDSRGIITIDLIFASLILLVIVGGILSVVSERMDAVSSTDELGNARMIGENTAEAINKAYNGGDGHAITLSLPANISDKNYDIKVNSSGIFVLVDGMIGKSLINPKKISCSDKLIESTVLMHGNHNYLIKNVKSDDGNNWIVISEV